MTTRANFPFIDVTKLDFSKFDASTFGLPKLDLSKLDLSKLRDLDFPAFDAEKVTTILRDAVYVAVGFGVLTFQQLQVRRRELADSLGNHPVIRQLGLTKAQLDELAAKLQTRLAPVEARIDAFEARLDTAVTRVESRLPEPVGAALGQAHEIAKAARKQVRGLLRSPA